MAITIERGPLVSLGVRIGYAKAPSAKLIVMSLSNAAASVDCNSVNHPVTWVPTDSDGGAHSPAGFTGVVTVSGLTQFTSYPYTVTQGANSVNGSFRTLPGEHDDFCFYVLTCDADASKGGGIHTGHGFYKNIKQQVQAGGLPCVGIFHTDDHGYVASRSHVSGKADSLDTQTPATQNTNYSYASAYLNYYGLHGGSGTSGLGEADYALNNLANGDIGRNPDRVWCNQNLPMWPQWGDWEFGNDIGMDFPTTNPGVANGYHKTYAGAVGNKDGGGYLAWQTFFKPLQPPSIAASDLNANHWALDLGCARLIAADGITNCNGSISSYVGNIAADDAAVTQVGSMLGANQIADILSVGQHYKPFTLLGLANGIRYMADSTTEFTTGTQHPLKNHCPAEFSALFTNSNSLSEKPAQLITLHGDMHHGHAYKHNITDGVIPTDFYEIGAGTVTASANFSSPNPVGAVYKGSTVEYVNPLAGNSLTTFWGVRVSVLGSKQTRELKIELMGSASEVLWSGRFIGWAKSQKFNADFPIYNLVSP